MPVAVRSLSGVAAIALGAHHSCALLNDGEVSCWGSDQFGELGDGAAESYRTTPAIVGGLPVVVTLRAGGAHTCAIDGKNLLYCWGANDNGELGSSLTAMVTTPHSMGWADSDVALGSGHACFENSADWIQCSGYTLAAGGPTLDMYRYLALHGAAAGDFHTCMQTWDRSNPAAAHGVACWGSNTRGQCADTPPFVSPFRVVEF